MDRVSPKNLAKIMSENEHLLEEITDKENECKKLKEKLKQSNTPELAQPIVKQLTEIERILIEKRTLILELIEKLHIIRDINNGQDVDDITDSDTLNSVKSIARDDERPLAVRIDDETQTSFPINNPPVIIDTESQFVQTMENKPATDDFKILRTMGSDKDIFEIENMKHQQTGEPTSDVIVAAKLKQPEVGSSVRKSELILKNVPTCFETTFVEPDQTTTEVTVDADGNRHILVKKSRVIHHREVIEGEPIEILEEVHGESDVPQNESQTHTSVIRTVVSQVTRKIIRKTRKIIKKIVIIDGKEHVTEEIVEEPEEVEISEDDLPNVNVNIVEYMQSPDDETFKPICEVPANEEPIKNIEEHVVIQESEEVIDEPPVQVFESVIAPVDLDQASAPVIVTATKISTEQTTTTVLELAEPMIELEGSEEVNVDESDDKTYSVSEVPMEKVIEPTSAIDEEVKIGPAPENIDKIWPDIPVQEDHSSSHSSKVDSVASAPVSLDETKPIWPVNDNIGSDINLEEYAFEPARERSTEEERALPVIPQPVEEMVIEGRSGQEKPDTLPIPDDNTVIEVTTITMHATQNIEKLSPDEDKASITMTIPSITSENQESSLNVSVKNKPMVLNLNITEEVVRTSPKTTPETPTKHIETEPSIKEVLNTEIPALPTIEVIEKALELVEDTGPSVSESRKTKRKKKHKEKSKPSDDSTDDQSSIAQDSHAEKVGQETEITPEESYRSISSVSEVDPVKIVEESTVPELESEVPQMGAEIVQPITVIDTMYVEESEQQTSLPYDANEPVTEQIKAIVDLRSATTSPEPIIKTEVEIQTTEEYKPMDNDPVEKELIHEEIQTEETTEQREPADVTDNVSQTVIEVTATSQQTVDEAPEISPEDAKLVVGELVDDIIAHLPTPTNTQSSNTDPTPKLATISIQTVTTTDTYNTNVPTVPVGLEKPQDLEIEASILIPGQSIPEFQIERQYVVDEDNTPIQETVPVGSSHVPMMIQTVSPKGNKVQISVISKTVVERLYTDGKPTDEHELSLKTLAIDEEHTEQQVALKKDLNHRLQFTKSIATNRSPISEIAHLATMDDYVTPVTSEERVATISDSLATLDESLKNNEPVVTHQTVTIIIQTISTWLETIEYRVLVNRDSRVITPEGKMSEFNCVRKDLEHVDGFIRKLQSTMDQQPRDEEVDKNIRGCVDVVVQHLNILENIAQESECEIKTNFLICSEYQMDVDNIVLRAQSFKTRFDQWLMDDAPLETKLIAIDDFERANAEMQREIISIIERRHQLQMTFPEKEVSRQIFTCQEMVNRSAQDISLERNRLDQLVNLGNEYEQTLHEFSKIIGIAYTLVETKIIVTDYESLQIEIQKHRKFFVNLSHCRSILDSLEEHLDPKTRDRHIDLHHRLHGCATDMLEKASNKAQTLALAASKWTTLEKALREEKQWLEIVQQRIPDLATVSTADYDRYITMYQTLVTDLAYHHSKWMQLTSIAVNLQELVTAPQLEEECNSCLFKIFQLKEDVQKDLRKLNKFRQNWDLYEEATNKIDNWMVDTEHQLDKINIPRFSEQYPLEHLRIFWEIKAHFELYSSVKNDARNNFEQAMQILPVTDEILQREFWARLHQKWENIDIRINEIFNKIMSNMSDANTPDEDKLSILEQELMELNNNINFTKGVIKNQNELQLYIERLQILNKRVNIVGTELGHLGLKTYIDAEKVGELFTMSHRISTQVSEETDCALVLQDQLNRISMGIIKIRMSQKAAVEKLEHCENVERSSKKVVENTLTEVERWHEDMGVQWQEIMNLRQLLHTLPQSLKLSVSPVMLERDISQLQDDHDILMGRCDKLIKLLRHLAGLWSAFEYQMDETQHSIQQTDYTMELLKVHGQIDFDRLVKATARLEVSANFICYFSTYPFPVYVLLFCCIDFPIRLPSNFHYMSLVVVANGCSHE